MLDRRTVLRRSAAALGTTTLAGLAGCTFSIDSESSSSTGTFLTPLPDPTPAIVPNFHCAYGYEPATMRTAFGDGAAMPELAGRLFDVIGEMEGTTVEDLYRLAGQTVRQVGHSGGDISLVSPLGNDLVVDGEIDVEGAAGWLASQDQLSDLGRSRGYRRFGNGGPTVEGFAVDADALTYGNREGTDLSPAYVTSAAIDGLADDNAAAASTTPELAATVDALPDGTATIATRFDLVAERPDTGTPAVDATAASLVAAGIDATVGDDPVSVTRVLRYRRGRVADPVDVSAAVDRAVAQGDFLDGDWSVSASGRTVRIEGSVAASALVSAPAQLLRAVPAPGYETLSEPIDPGALGRDAPPRVNWSVSETDDGRIAVEHADGSSVSDLAIVYEANGEQRVQPWGGPIERGDRLVTDAAPDPGTILDIVWARDTANETILTRVQLPSE